MLSLFGGLFFRIKNLLGLPVIPEDWSMHGVLTSRNLSSLRFAQIGLHSFGNLFSLLTRLYSMDGTCGPSPVFSSWFFHLDCYGTSQLAPFYILHIPRFRSRTSGKSIFFSSRNVPVKIR